MSDIGLEAYRFTISWSRIIPGGRREVNPKGLQFYNDLINELVKAGIQINAVLYPMDLPQILEEEYGGWVSPKIIDDFTAYADVCFRGLELIFEYFREKYGNLPFYIQDNSQSVVLVTLEMESGFGGADDTLDDVERIGYLSKFIASTLKAIRNGADVRGYSVWSFMDLYELFGGFKKHYVIFAVDFDSETRRRQLRRSARWYSDFFKNITVVKADRDFAAEVSYSTLTTDAPKIINLS